MMKTALVGTGVLGMVLAVALGGCAEGESPIVGNETGGAAGSGGSVGTGGSGATPGGGGQTDLSGSTTFSLSSIRIGGSTNEDPFRCSERLPLDPQGDPTCRLYAVALGRGTDDSCTCGSGSQRPAPAAVSEAILDYVAATGQCEVVSGGDDCSDVCACEVPAAEGDAKTACQNDIVLGEGEGWCYVSYHQGVGNPAVVAACPDTQMQRIRLLGADITPDDLHVLACSGWQMVPPGGAVEPKPLGEPCVPDDERLTSFAGFRVTDVSVDSNAGCDSNLCLVNHFQGRVSCPFGQFADPTVKQVECFVPGTDIEVTPSVDPQLVARRAEQTAVCSCRCAGEGSGPFCACPADMECSPLIERVGLSTDQAFAGSYCIPRGTAYDPTTLDPESCDRLANNCGDADPN